ncbi:MAG: hypothetical protein C0614_11340 [Desulfuromonas sp.]|nr:MAG: hypothetical protein C0614_11340 [Desulfuromonas sp.]
MQDLKQTKAKQVKQNRRKKEKRPFHWRNLLLRSLRVVIATGSGFLLVCGALLTAQLLLESGYFDVRLVRVEQNQRVNEGEILAASDIKEGDSLFELDLHMIGTKIEENPWIARAEIERVFPDSVVIRVQERVPRAIVDLDYLYYVDAEGVVFKMLDHQDNLGFPVMTGIDRQSLLEAKGIAKEWLKAGLELMNVLEKRELFNLDDVSQVHYDEQQGLVLFTYHWGVPIHMGRGGFADKLDRLERIYPELEPRLASLSYIDLNVADRVIVKVESRRSAEPS